MRIQSIAAAFPKRQLSNDAVIDLDTVMPGLPLYDFGEMMRTSASSTAEDDPQAENMALVVPYFRVLVEGYLASAVGGVLNATERAHLGFAGKLMTYENGLRFLTDWLEGDTYFKIKRPTHNLDRCRTQFKLVASIEEQHVTQYESIIDPELFRLCGVRVGDPTPLEPVGAAG